MEERRKKDNGGKTGGRQRFWGMKAQSYAKAFFAGGAGTVIGAGREGSSLRAPGGEKDKSAGKVRNEGVMEGEERGAR